ncbi:helix-turn-helix domain-containing protein [Desulfovibrio sp. OttesenSCG-928-C14]|nr:helix-turn-helix domain-containing protein [Desulfovibrio sp. OttesenSCG-928-C14]
MVHFDEVFERIKLATNTRTQMELAKVLDIRQSSISDAKRRNSVPADWYLKLFESFGLNPAWLKSASGPMYLRTENGYTPSDGPDQAFALNEGAAQYNDPDAKAAVVSVHSAMRPFSEDAPSPGVSRLSLPASFVQPGLYVIRLESSAMEPHFNKGAYVGLDTGCRNVASGELYGVNLPYEGVAIKRIFLDATKGTMILRSEKPAHPEMVLPIEEQKSIVGRVLWVLQKM